MTDRDGSDEEPQAPSIREETQPRKHEADRRFERKTVLLAAVIAATVTFLGAAGSSVGLAWSVNKQIRSADHRDNRTFWRQQEAASISTWLQTAAAVDMDEVNASTIVTPPPSSAAPSAGSVELAIQTAVLKLAEETSALKLFVSQETYQAAQKVSKMQGAVLNQLLNDLCPNGKSPPPAGCAPSKPSIVEQISNAEDQVRDLAQIDLNKPNAPNQ
jgi:hypothetical protein